MNSRMHATPELVAIAEWTTRLGLIVPSCNTVMEYEFHRLLPQGTSLHVSRIAHTGDTDPALLHMLGELEPAAALLAHARVDAISFG
jgi:maleate cis-trans isomerase